MYGPNPPSTGPTATSFSESAYKNRADATIDGMAYHWNVEVQGLAKRKGVGVVGLEPTTDAAYKAAALTTELHAEYVQSIRMRA